MVLPDTSAIDSQALLVGASQFPLLAPRLRVLADYRPSSSSMLLSSERCATCRIFWGRTRSCPGTGMTSIFHIAFLPRLARLLFGQAACRREVRCQPRLWFQPASRLHSAPLAYAAEAEAAVAVRCGD